MNPRGLLRLVWKEFNSNECMQRASAMAYATLLALVPLLTLSFGMVAQFGKFSKVENFFQEKVLRHFIPTTGNKLFETISGHLDTFIANAAAINVVGVIFLALTSISLFAAAEGSLNAIWRVKKTRTFFARYNAFCGLLLGMPLLIGGSLYISSLFSYQSTFAPVTALAKLFYTMMPLLLTWGGFMLFYRAVPFTQVHWVPAMFGGVVAGTLWETAKFGYGVYVSKAVTTSLIYGSLGSLVLFLVWIYFTWVIVLLGAQISYVTQNYKTLAQELR